MASDGAFRHRALFYADEAGFLGGTVPFIREGIENGEPVLVAVSQRKIDLLREELNGLGEEVSFAEMDSFGRNPARLIPVWRDFVADAGDRPMRGVGELAWPGRSDDELAECDRHESLLNAAFGGLRGDGFALLCPFDASGLDDDVLTAARRNHTELICEGGVSMCPEYLDPAGAADPFRGDLPPVPKAAVRMEFGAETLVTVRRFVGERAAWAGLPPDARADVALAVHELAANSIRHGGGDGAVIAWEEPGALVCQVEDAGRFRDPLAGRRRPDCEQLNGRGLWIANQLCDLAQVRSGAAGSVVRVRVSA